MSFALFSVGTARNRCWFAVKGSPDGLFDPVHAFKAARQLRFSLIFTHRFYLDSVVEPRYTS